MSTIGDAASALVALVLYKNRILPAARAELRRFESLAGTIPDPILRKAALSALREKGLNVEAVAVFAILAPRSHRLPALRTIVTLQAIVDYVDTLGEQSPLADGLALHQALSDALSLGVPVSDWYRLHPQKDDGGYLATLVGTCRREVATLPALQAVQPLARESASSCGAGQSHTHTAAQGDPSQLEAWVASQTSPPGYGWWEVAAGASSSVRTHALVAAAADPRTSAREAELINAAYHPSIGALTVLLDSLIDRDEDIAAGEHNYTSYYPTGEVAAARFAFIADQATAATRGLPRSHRHRAILSGVAGLYLAAPGAGSEYARPVRDALLRSLGPNVKLIRAAMRGRLNA